MRDRLIRPFTREHVAARKFTCDNCGEQIWGTYSRQVFCRVVRGAHRTYSNLYVERHCRECM